MKFFSTLVLLVCFAWGAVNVTAQESSLTRAINTIKAVDVGGQGHEQAVAALKELNNASADAVPQILQAMDGANRLSLNWLRGAVQTALNKGPLPREELKAFLQDESGSAMGRLMAFELLSDADAAFGESRIGDFLEDPSLPLRQLSVNHFIANAKEAEIESDALSMLVHALPHARDVGQVSSIVSLMGERGVQVNLQKQLGFVPTWHIAGPFDNRNEEGFDRVMGPEQDPANIDIDATYEDGKEGQTVEWVPHNTVDATGMVDVNSVLTEEKGVIAYAYTNFRSDEDRDVEIRIGCINGNKVWVNGQEVINNEIYHVGMQPDQFVGKARLKKGDNAILFKVCQNEQTQPWANRWAFQLRVCDDTGKAIAPAVVAQQQ